MLKNLKLKAKDQKGFTLIELLAVIVILGIIAAIAIPAIGNVITKSDNKAKVQDALLIIDAAKLYVAENNPGGPLFLSLEGDAGGDGSTAAKTLALDSYLDRVKDSDFIVEVGYTPATATVAAKYTYTISNHVGASVENGTDEDDKATAEAEEKDLVEYSKNN